MVNSKIIVGLGFGDESKGSSVDWLTSQYNTNAVVRFSGGSQAAHAVSLENGIQHVFAQFGSGTLRGVRTILSSTMMVNPFTMAEEANVLWDKTGDDPFEKTLISSSSPLITPIHVAANRKREIARGDKAHGSCGHGIGETASYYRTHPVSALEINDMRNTAMLGAKLDMLRAFLEKELGELDAPSTTDIIGGYLNLMDDRNFQITSDYNIYSELRKGFNVFEGSQGVLLDESYGFHPHTTWSNVLPFNAQRLLATAGLPPADVVGVTRSYTTRHGNGPFPSEFTNEEQKNKFPELHNTWGQFQGSWRAGTLDLVLLNYAARVTGGVNEMYVSHMDYPFTEAVVAYRNPTTGDIIEQLPVSTVKDLNFQQNLTDLLFAVEPVVVPVENAEELLLLIKDATGAPVTVTGHGPSASDRAKI